MQVNQLPMNELADAIHAELSAKGTACLLVTGHSMVPLLRNGRDSVILSLPTQKPAVGDIVFFQRNAHQLVLHRVIAVDGTGLICCGDHQSIPETVRHDQILAVVTAFCRAGKTHSVHKLSYRFYARLTVLLFPMRRPWLAVRKLAGKLRRVFRKH